MKNLQKHLEEVQTALDKAKAQYEGVRHLRQVEFEDWLQEAGFGLPEFKVTHFDRERIEIYENQQTWFSVRLEVQTRWAANGDRDYREELDKISLYVSMNAATEPHEFRLVMLGGRLAEELNKEGSELVAALKENWEELGKLQREGRDLVEQKRKLQRRLEAAKKDEYWESISDFWKEGCVIAVNERKRYGSTVTDLAVINCFRNKTVRGITFSPYRQAQADQAPLPVRETDRLLDKHSVRKEEFLEKLKTGQYGFCSILPQYVKQ